MSQSKLELTFFGEKKKSARKSELAKMVRDYLAQNGTYMQVVEEMRVLREKKKSIENGVRASCLSDVREIDTLSLQISAAKDLMSDIALTMYAEGKTVEIVDKERGVRYVPEFSVKFRKENLEKV